MMKKVNPNIKAIKLWSKFSPLYFPMLIMNSIFKIISPYFNIYLSAEIVNEISSNNDYNKTLKLIIITVVGNLVISFFSIFFSRILALQEVKLSQNENKYYINKTLNLDYSYLEDVNVRQLRRKIAESSRINGHGKSLLLASISRLINITLNMFFSIMLFVEMIYLIVISKETLFLIIYIVLSIILIIFNIRFIRYSKKIKAKVSENISQTMIEENRIDDAIDSYNMGKDVRLYRQDKIIMKLKEYSLNIHKKAFKKIAFVEFKNSVPINAFSCIINILSYLMICIYSLKGIFGIGSVIKYVGIIQKFVDGILSYSNVLNDIKYNTSFISDYLSYFEIENKFNNGTIEFDIKTDINKIEFKNVSFYYPGTKDYIIKDLSFIIGSNEKVAIVGENGSGKSTLIKLLCRLYDPIDGEILVNDINIKDYKYDSYLKKISIVFQDFKLFSFTLGENIAGTNQYDENIIEKHINDVGLRDRYNKMDLGLKTYLYKDFDKQGIEISGGEAQKIALARALNKKTNLIILDEPTSALDPIAEAEIYQNVNELTKDKLVLFISHRLSSCKFCNKIMVLHNGDLIQYGNHSELILDESGKYYELWNAQAQYYK